MPLTEVQTPLPPRMEKYMEIVKKTTTEIRESVDLENGEVKDLLYKLYREIWCQACFDPDTVEIGEFCGRKLLPHISRLNKILRFSK